MVLRKPKRTPRKVFCNKRIIFCSTGVLRRGRYKSGKNHFHEMSGDVGMAGWK